LFSAYKKHNHLVLIDELSNSLPTFFDGELCEHGSSKTLPVALGKAYKIKKGQRILRWPGITNQW